MSETVNTGGNVTFYYGPNHKTPESEEEKKFIKRLNAKLRRIRKEELEREQIRKKRKKIRQALRFFLRSVLWIFFTIFSFVVFVLFYEFLLKIFKNL